MCTTMIKGMNGKRGLDEGSVCTGRSQRVLATRLRDTVGCHWRVSMCVCAWIRHVSCRVCRWINEHDGHILYELLTRELLRTVQGCPNL